MSADARAIPWHHVVGGSSPSRRLWAWSNPPDHKKAGTVTLVDPYFNGSRAVPLNRTLLDMPLEVATSDLIVLRGVTVEDLENERVSPDQLVDQLQSKSGHRPGLAVLQNTKSSSALPKLECISVYGADNLGVDLRALRALEFSSQLSHTGAIYSPKDMHFQLPSGFHADKYVRVADAFDDLTSISRTADWIQHRLTTGTVLLSDTWTVLPLLQELDHRMMVAESERGSARAAERILTFPQYPTLSQIRQILDRIPPLVTNQEQPRVLFVLSVVSSGDLFTIIQELAQSHLKGINVETIALVNSADSILDLEAHCDVPVDRYDTSRRACKLCQDPQRKPVVLIDGRRYFPLIQSESRPVMLSHTEASKNRRFWEIASRTSAVSVHSEEVSKGKPRHLHLMIKIERLLADVDFASQVRIRLLAFCPKADLVLIPEHPATTALRILAQAAYPEAIVRTISRTYLQGSPEDAGVHNAERLTLSDELVQAQSVLILDDVAIYGETIKSLHRYVQELSHEIATMTGVLTTFKLRCFVVVARPERTSQWENLVQSLRQSGDERFLECHLLLPLPYGDCPWCEESDLLEKILRLEAEAVAQEFTNSAERHDAVRLRLAHLRQAQQGMTASMFICNREGHVGDHSEDSLTPHSLFGEGLTESAAYAAVCAAMHNIRLNTNQTAPIQGFSWYWDVVKIINVYHDPILQASFLRSARTEELLFPYPRDLIATIEQVMFDFKSDEMRQSAVVIGEHALSAALGKYGTRVGKGVLANATKVATSWKPELGEFIRRMVT